MVMMFSLLPARGGLSAIERTATGGLCHKAQDSTSGAPDQRLAGRFCPDYPRLTPRRAARGGGVRCFF